ncbi:hypothetical protein SAMN02746019_00003290 [Thermoflexus hugenholtzii JAD2]|uniref:Band 7 domain-containing protein n=2 Tax=Thermoflexus TaxID=1495649 RepID=A0A212QQ03_9CHLR|nr:hypothetical protein SAMN02746019_00003290 [Thermoflexus hugenholtzii JAD2]
MELLLRVAIVFAAGLPGLLLIPLLIGACLIGAWRGERIGEILGLGCGLGLLMEGAIAAFMLVQASNFVARMYQVRWGEALGFLLRALFFPHARTPVGHARDGDLTAATRTSPLVRIGGPGTLVVHESCLVLLERGGVFVRLIGPGEHRLRPFERPALVLDLRPQIRRRQVNAWTQDGLPVQARLELGARLRWEPGDAAGEARLIRMAYALDTGSRDRGYGVDWAGELADEARNRLARRLGTLWFDELWSPYTSPEGAQAQPPRFAGEPAEQRNTRGIPERPPEDAPIPVRWEQIREEIRAELEEQAARWNAQILHFAFTPPMPRPEVEPLIRQAWLEHWQVPWRGWVVHMQSRAVREQLRQRELARAMGQRELLEAITAVVREEWSAEDPQRGLHRLLLRLVELVQHWAQPEMALLTPKELLELFHHLQRIIQSPQGDTGGASGGAGASPAFPSDSDLE